MISAASIVCLPSLCYNWEFLICHVYVYMCCKVKEEASQGRSSDTLHVDPSGLVTLSTPNRLATLSVRAIPLPQGKT